MCVIQGLVQGLHNFTDISEKLEGKTEKLVLLKFITVLETPLYKSYLFRTLVKDNYFLF